MNCLQEKKSKKLQSPNFHVSRTRVVIYNLPKTMTEKELRKLFIDAVISRATRQNPRIRQVKFLDDTKKGKIVAKNHSRRVAFVEFSEHQHALVALRVLNNNPGSADGLDASENDINPLASEHGVKFGEPNENEVITCERETDESAVGEEICKRDVIFEPQNGLKFETKEAAYSFYRKYARSVEFGITAAVQKNLENL